MKKAVLAWAIILLALPALSTNACAGNLSLGSGIGMHTFDITESTDQEYFTSDGYFSIKNLGDSDMDVIIEIETKLSAVDLDNGQPREHTVYDNVVFGAMPTEDWIILKDSSFNIGPKSSERLDYTIKVPASAIDTGSSGNIGYLAYIKVREINVNESGNVHIGVQYSYKVFVVFNLTSVKGGSGFQVPIIIFPIIIVIISIAVVYLFRNSFKSKRHRADKKIVRQPVKVYAERQETPYPAKNRQVVIPYKRREY
jgi:hypothetical protein